MTDWNTAGPKLLEAVKPIEKALTWNGRLQQWTLDPGMKAGSIQELRAAIAKATQP